MESGALDELERRLACDPSTAPLPLRPGEPCGPLELIVPAASARAAVLRYPRACCVLCLQQPKTPAALAVLPMLCESGRVLACSDVVRAVVAALPPTAHSIERAGLVLLCRFCARRATQASSAAAAAGGGGSWSDRAADGSIGCPGGIGGGGSGTGCAGDGTGVGIGGGDARSIDDGGCSVMLSLICTCLAQHLTLDLASDRITFDTLRDGLSTRNAPRAAAAKAAAAVRAAAVARPAGAASPDSVGSSPSGSALSAPCTSCPAPAAPAAVAVPPS
eukprot:scaffold26091_cov101-Isochrysis_galbana.AAC.1